MLDTTRPKRDGEIDGREYYFVESREEMEREIHEGRFVEAGKFGGNLYGTSLADVNRVARNVVRLRPVPSVYILANCMSAIHDRSGY